MPLSIHHHEDPMLLYPPGFRLDFAPTSLGRMAYVTAKGSPWSALPSTDQQPTLVFLHGLGGGSSSYEWSKVYPAFASRYRILAPDLVGWGNSDHPARSYQSQDYVSTILDFIEKTCPDPPIVIASSITAAFAIRAAIAQPERFKQLILINPSGLSDFGQPVVNSLFAQILGTPGLDQLIYYTAIANPVGIRTFLEQRQFAVPQRIHQEIVDAYLDSALRPNAEYAALSFVRGSLSFDLALDLPRLTTPTRILWGQSTQFTEPSMGQRLAQLNPEAVQSFQIVPETGLTPQLELPAVTIGLLWHCLDPLS